MNNIDKRVLHDSAESTIGIMENIAGFEPSDIDGDTAELRFENESDFDTGCDVSIVDQCQKAADVIRALLDELEAAEKRNAEMSESNRLLCADSMIKQDRIAELEARKVKIKLPESFYPDGDIDCPLVINEYQIIEAIVAADCKPIAVCPRCKCELDLSHKPDGAHYCHPAATAKGE